MGQNLLNGARLVVTNCPFSTIKTPYLLSGAE